MTPTEHVMDRMNAPYPITDSIARIWRALRDGLSCFASSRVSPSRPEASIPREEKPRKTNVYLRSTKVPANFWEDEVRYDAWGAPYIRGYGIRKGTYDGPATALHSDGTTDATWLSGTRWKHKSGPPVRFGKAPAHPFESERTGA